MGSELHDQLRSLADEVRVPTLDVAGVWREERRRRTVRLVISVGTAACLALMTAIGLAGWLRSSTPEVAEPVPFAELHLPNRLYAPDPWSAGTDEAGPPGPLAAVWIGDRSERDGWGTFDYPAHFGISAVDGSARFLDIATTPEARGEFAPYPYPALSPDGRKVAYPTVIEEGITALSVYDVVTGDVLALGADADMVTYLNSMAELTFSGDSRYVVALALGRQGDEKILIAWDVESGKPYILEQTTKYWQPSLGVAESGVVWARGRTAYARDPGSSTIVEREVDNWIVKPSIGPPPGPFAYIGHGGKRESGWSSWRLYIANEGEPESAVDVGFAPDRIEGWTDASHVVVHGEQDLFAVVDVRSGEVTTHQITGATFALTLASDLWANDLVDGVQPPDATSDTWRFRVLVTSAGLLVLVVIGLTLRRRRRRLVGP